MTMEEIRKMDTAEISKKITELKEELFNTKKTGWEGMSE